MLYSLFKVLMPYYSGFNVFNYLTTRALMAGMTALIIGWGFGPFVIRRLRALKIGQAVRSTGPQTHLQKTGTPTMGGVLVLISIVLSTLLWADLSNRFVWIVLFVTVSLGIVGWVDDYRKVVYQDPAGMSAKEKFFWQAVIALIVALYLAFALAKPDHIDFCDFVINHFTQMNFLDLDSRTNLIVPFFKNISYPLGIFGFVILTWVIIVGSSNAVNLTDGLDGLAILPTVIVGAALGIFAYVVGRVDFSNYFLFPYIPGAGEILILSMALLGAGLAFLWFNAYPAQVFMGDVGALALGGMLGAMAVIVRQELVFFIMSGIFVAEVLSVVIQVSWFRYTKKKYGKGRRLLRMSPLHHHFEEKGWHETKVVIRFWIINILLVLIGLLTLKIR